MEDCYCYWKVLLSEFCGLAAKLFAVFPGSTLDGGFTGPKDPGRLHLHV